MRWLVRFGYDGTAFHGWARQPGQRTVEGEIRRALARGPAAGDPARFSLEVASRTDRGVSARANALAVRSPLPGATLLRTLNGIDPDLFFTATTPIPDEFRVRRAKRRTYRYFEATPTRDEARRAEAARLFFGEVDVRSLGRAIPAAVPTRRRVESVVVRTVPGGAEIEVRAPSFVWGMVRKIVAALREVDAGRLSVTRLGAALDGKVRLTLPVAEAEPLVLWEVEYELPWTIFWRGPNRAQRAARTRRAASLWTRAHLIDALSDAPDDPIGPDA
ncbi:MAG: tRNA pseudouridine synthase A [Thermoplasmata archaeon]